MFLHDLASGDKVCRLVGHQNDITQLSLDHGNKLIASAGYDATVIIQMFSGHKFETKKVITNCNYSKPVTLLEVSVHHNIFLTASDHPVLYAWDYEFNRLISSIQIVSFRILVTPLLGSLSDLHHIH
jgi:WD40 repeat protein